MADVPDQPHPLDAQEFADLKDEWDFHGGWQPHRDLAARLVATVEARDTQVADAHAVIRCLLSGFRPHHRGEDHWCRNPFGSGHEHDARAYPMTPGEVAAITAARATEGAGGE